MSDQPSGLPGQPSASAIGRHMAITTGLNTRLLGVPVTRSSLWVLRQAAFSTGIYRAEAGLHTVACTWPDTIISPDSSEPSAVALMLITLPLAVLCCSELYCLTSGARHCCFSEPYKMGTLTPAGATMF